MINQRELEIAISNSVIGYSQGKSLTTIMQDINKIECDCNYNKEPKVYHAENCNDAVRGKFYEFFNYALDQWIMFKLKNIFPRTAMPFSPNDGGSLFPIIRECEQPEEKVRVVTFKEFKERAFSIACDALKNKGLNNFYFDDLSINAYEFTDEKASDLFGEKVVVKND